MPLKLSDVAAQIRVLDNFLIENSLADKLNHASIKKHPNKKSEICISSCNDISFTLASMKYEELYNESLKRRLYNYLMLDGALIQFHYMFDGDRIYKHRLAYLPSPTMEAFQEEPEIFSEQPLYADILEPSIMPVPIRFDFDISAFEAINHPMSHLTLGQYKNCRIPVISPISPMVFIDFLLKSFYNTAYRSYYRDLKIKDEHIFNPTIDPIERNSVHIGFK